MLIPDKGVALFTDGSCWTGDRIGGWAYLALDAHGNTTEDSGGGWDTTISRMELQGPIEGLMAIGIACGPCDVLVYSDSEYVVLGATNRKRKRNHHTDLWDLLYTLIDSHNYVEFNHVKGHADSKYNDLVDKAAGNARRAAQGK
jgi:ribonuclease HI